MSPFTFVRANTLPEALSFASDREIAVIAGGTEMVNWLKEGIAQPTRLADIDRLPELREIDVTSSGLRVGALARMSDVARHPEVQRDFPALSQALLKSASAQLRNMASMGGNLLQRTRCPYFRAETELPCNKRRPGTGCAAQQGEDRSLAIFGGSEHCIATHPSDAAVALAALDAVVIAQRGSRTREIPLVDFHRLPGDSPQIESVLELGELIIALRIPASGLARHSLYLKLRERASYEFALVSVAAGLIRDGRRISEVRLALGGVAPKPWRLPVAEAALRGVDLGNRAALRSAVDRGFADARPGKQNGFKIELASRLVVQALEQLGAQA